jgi:hypothetical protein
MKHVHNFVDINVILNMLIKISATYRYNIMGTLNNSLCTRMCDLHICITD